MKKIYNFHLCYELGTTLILGTLLFFNEDCRQLFNEAFTNFRWFESLKN